MSAEPWSTGDDHADGGRAVRPRGHLRRGQPREPSRQRIDHLRYDWFPVRVQPGREKLARILMEDRGFVTFCPMEIKWRHCNRQAKARNDKRQIAYPWHPGLVFVGMLAPYRWHLVVSLPMVRGVIGVRPDSPRRLRPDAVWRLMDRFGEGRFVPPDEQRWMPSGAEFAVGDRVRVVRGAMEGQMFTVEMIRGRMAVLFGRWFGADMGFEAPLSMLARD